MQNPSLVERITRSLAYMLRHQPEQFDLEVDEYGFADLDDVVGALNERLGEPVEAEDVVEAIDGGDRPRYEIREGKIRALYGHSIQVKPGEPGKPPALLYVGISRADAERARRYGLRPGRRSFLHLALNAEEALETGKRASRDYAVVTVNALDAWEEGINFYDRKSLFLSDPIPTHFLQVGDVQTDGYGDAEEGERQGRGDRGDRGGRFGRGEGPRREPRHEPVRSEEPRHELPRYEPVRPEGGRPEFARSEGPRHEAPGREAGGGEREHAGVPAGRERVDQGHSQHGPRGRDRHGRGDRRPDARGEGRGGFRGDNRPPRDSGPPDRRDHGPRPERRDSRGPAPARPPMDRPPQAAPTAPAPRAEAAAPSSGSFGLGVFEAPPRTQEAPPRREPEVRAREVAPPPERPPETARVEPDDSFGAGI